MKLSITAMYAATDGRTPESVQVEWDDFGPSAHPSGEDIRDLIGLLFTAPDIRRSTYAGPPAPASPVSVGMEFRAGVDLTAGDRVGFAADGFTLYLIGDRRVTMSAGSAAEDVPVGTAMTPDNTRSLTSWSKA